MVKSIFPFAPVQVVGEVAVPATKIGKALTVIVGVVLLHPVTVSVKVNFTFPLAIAVTCPVLVTVALLSSLLAQTPPILGISVRFSPLQIAVVGTLMVGRGLTVTVAEAERFSVQAPSLTDTNLSVWFAVTPEIVTVAVPPVRVVVVLEPSLTLYVTTAPLVPIRVKMALLPAQMAEFVPLMVAVAAHELKPETAKSYTASLQSSLLTVMVAD